MTAPPASPLAVLGSGPLAAYWRFHEAVARAQLAAWLRGPPRLLLDISGPAGTGAELAAAHGHTVLRAVPGQGGLPMPGAAPDRATGAGDGRPAARQRMGWPRGRIATVLAEPGSLAFIGDGCVDGVLADDCALSRQLVTEDLAVEIARVLRAGGELLACVDSLVLGMAILAEQRHWAQLTDLPHSEVVLIPWPDGTITRCFGAAQLTDLLTEAGLEVSWIRPRTVLSPSMVDHVLRRDTRAMARLVRAELAAGDDQTAGFVPEESFGIRLVVAARRPR